MIIAAEDDRLHKHHLEYSWRLEFYKKNGNQSNFPEWSISTDSV